MGNPSEVELDAWHIAEARMGSAKLLRLLKKYHGPKRSKPYKRRAKPIELEPIPLVKAEGPRIEAIKLATARYFNIPACDLDAPDTGSVISYQRHVAMYLARTLARRTFPQIGRMIGGRHHTTAIHGIYKIKKLIQSDWTVAYDVAHVEALVGAQ